MKKKKVLYAVVAAISFLSVATILSLNISNKDIFDTIYKYDEAIVSLADGSVVKGQVQNWTDYKDGDQIQVKIDGIIYLVHASNITLIAK